MQDIEGSTGCSLFLRSDYLHGPIRLPRPPDRTGRNARIKYKVENVFKFKGMNEQMICLNNTNVPDYNKSYM